MPTTKMIPVSELSLDKKNFRTPPQKSDAPALRSMVAVDAPAFWALMESLLDDGYLPTENIVVMENKDLGPDGSSKYVVREGNRRVAAIKIVLGLLKTTGLEIPESVRAKLENLLPERESSLQEVPCAVYSPAEAEVVDRIVALTHGKGQKAGRTAWSSVARARHNRDTARASEPGLDILEAYLKSGPNLSSEEKARWGGQYPLTVLDEALKQ